MLAIEDVVVVVAPNPVPMDMQPDTVGPQTTSTEWLLTDTEPVSSGRLVVLPVCLGLASSIHNPTHTMVLETSEGAALSSQGVDRAVSSGNAEASVHVAVAKPPHSMSGPPALSLTSMGMTLAVLLAKIEDLAGQVSGVQQDMANLQNGMGAEHCRPQA